jgi:uncharacterized protein (DUF488 family)
MPQPGRLNLPSATAKAQRASQLLYNEARSPNDAHFFTLGYTGRPLSSLLHALGEAGVRCLIDVRENPVSMYRPEMSKRNLADHLAEIGVEYLHRPDLGVPRDVRARAIGAGTRQVIWDWYDEHVVPRAVGRNLHWFFNVAEHPVAFMCVERDPGECHRHRLFEALEAWGLQGFDL